VGVVAHNGLTNTGCTIVGSVDNGNAVAAKAYTDFLSAYNALAPLNKTCDLAHTLTGALTGDVLLPGVYCLDAVAKTGTLTLNADGNATAGWIFLVNGALTGTRFKVVMMNGEQPCNVYWWVEDAATLTDSTFQGTILAGAAITVTRGTLTGHALATAAATLTNPAVTACGSSSSLPPGVPPVDKCEMRHDKDRDHHDHQGTHYEGDHCDHERGVNGHYDGDGCEHDRLRK
jgi:hypothetical protein